VSQIFLFFASLANIGLAVTFYLGWRIDNPSLPAAQADVSMHFLFALAAASFAILVHAIVLTYFMGTGRWIEETSTAYSLEDTARKQNIQRKYKVIPGMTLCIFMIMITGAFGAIADPASNTQMAGAATIHFSLALATILANLIVSVIEYQQISQNSAIVDAVFMAVKQIRRDRGLDSPEDVTATEADSNEGEST